jgi:uncharacterized protein YggE
MRTCVVSLVSALLLSSPSWAQFPTNATRSIAVTGQAEVRVTPTLVNLVVGVETLNRSLPAAKAENDRRVQAIVQSMQALGVAPKDIQTDYIQVHPDYVTRNDTVTILRHYTVRKTVAVTLNDVTKFERALSDALQSGANHVLNVQFLTADLRKHRDEARARAVQAAREKAELLARELNARVGKVISIGEYSMGGPWHSYGNTWGGGRYGGAGMNQVSVQAGGTSNELLGDAIALGLIGVTASVSVRFELEPL